MKSKKAAMEMSVGTIVTIVLLMSVLVLGIFLVQKVFSSSTDAIDSIDNQVQSEISKLFADEDLSLVVYPTSREITLKKGDDPKGFAFSVKNRDVEPTDFMYEVKAEPSFDFTGRCGSTFSQAKANSFLLTNTGSFSLAPGNSLGLPELVKFIIPEEAAPCTIPYKLQVYKGQNMPYDGTTIFVTIK